MFTTRQILSISAFSAVLFSTAIYAQNAAIVNGKAIPKAQLDKLIQKSNQPDTPQVRDQAREMLVTRELILQEANKRGITQKESVRDQLEQSKMGVLIAAVFEDFVDREGVTEAELKAAYEQVKGQYTGKEYHVEHILVEKEADAKAITSQIKTGGNFAQIAKENKYCKPSLTEDAILNITAGRHPVIEKTLAIDQDYIPNDVFLDPATQQIIILTGPNMSGKSAVLRQTALITLMAHMGSYVPAQAASIPLTDKIFTRVGANDNLNAGESTFMVEMLETASILNNISARSLILLDEIGRGTSTYDGISIAWSIVEFLHQSKQKPKTLFATHYHELNDLEAQLSTVHNFHVSHKEVGNKIIFLRKLTKGGSTHSFGIHVAKMAGMPNILVNRANEILKEMELKNKGSQEFQLSIFDAHTETFESIRKELDEMDINNLTPVEALMKLQAIKKKLN